ncbi:unnamed protein product [Rotaria sp. Silwood1]|nr:unnamed protein product [Rotaria sp. Silwood1]CAF0935321.1 unnamed protein product [Rotaria sp. Silwood1]CAF1024545.1 unnamed protein product [Rotaria sp. Silwood1]CAF3365898.1 unnamed protein product [Rotaria sp. Silwood1]CAF3366432.1 unnamed protein product [Rotaria sp. Silwood1]
MFHNRRIRSRLIVLPFSVEIFVLGSITTTCTTNKNCLLTADHAHTRLCRTTLVREDNKIIDLNCLSESELYEANWKKLHNLDHIAKVKSGEVCCRMTPEFDQEYVSINNDQHRYSLLCVINPNKFRTCEYLISNHEQCDDKIIVFF